MDVITVGSPVAVDRTAKSTNSSSSAATVVSPESQFDPPPEERLLPIGGARPDVRRGDYAPGREGIIDRVWQVFGSMEPDSVPLIQEKVSMEKIQVVASVHKQDATCVDEKPANEEVTECYVGHVTHIRNGTKPDSGIASSINSSSKNESKIEVIETGNMLEPKKSSLKKKGSNNLEKHDGKVEIQVSHDGGGGEGKTIRQKTKKKRRLGTGSAPDQTTIENSSKASSVCGGGKNRENSSSSLLSSNRDNPLLLKQSALRIGEDSIVDRCSHCGAIKEEYSEDELSHCIVILNTFVNREPSLAAPLLPEILITLTRIANRTQFLLGIRFQCIRALQQ